MNNLLRGNFSRLWKNRIFYVFLIIVAVFAIALPVINYAAKERGTSPGLEAFIFAYVMFVSVLVCTFSALFLSTEYSDGTIRNKMIVGHGRAQIYLSNLIVCAAAGLVMCAVYLIFYFSVGIALLGKPAGNAKEIIVGIIVSFGIIIAFAALSVLIAMLCQNKAYSVAACILMIVIMIFANGYLEVALNQPEEIYYYTYVNEETGGTQVIDSEPNPNYVSGAKRAIYEFVQNMSPAGQGIRLTILEEIKKETYLLFDAAIVLLVTFIGAAAFKKKDIK